MCGDCRCFVLGVFGTKSGVWETDATDDCPLIGLLFPPFLQVKHQRAAVISH